MKSSYKPTVVWVMFMLGITTLLTPFIGFLLACLWRRSTDDPYDFVEYDTQIVAFWRAGMLWLCAFVFMGVGLYLDLQSSSAMIPESGMPMMVSIGVLIGVVTQIWFTVRAIWGLISSGLRPTLPSNAAL